MGDVEHDDRAWDGVRARGELSGEAKLAWLFIWKRARRRPGEVWFSLVELLADQGRRDVRSPRDWVERLRVKRFIEVLESGDGLFRVYVKEPQDVLRPAEARGFTDEQQRRLPLDQRESAAVAEAFSGARAAGDPAQNPPGDSAAGTLPLELRAHGPLLSPFTLNSKYEEKALINRTTAGDRAQDSPADADVAALERMVRARRTELGVESPGAEAPGSAERIGAIADLRGAVLAARAPGDELERVEALTSRIVRRVNDPLLQRGPAEYVARCVFEGRLPAREFEALLTWVDDTHKARPAARRWVLFVGCAHRVCARLEIEWPFASKRTRRGDC